MIGKIANFIKTSVFLAVAAGAIYFVGQASLQLLDMPQIAGDLGQIKVAAPDKNKAPVSGTTTAGEVVQEKRPNQELPGKLAPAPEVVAAPVAEKIVRVSETPKGQAGVLSASGVIAATNAERLEFLGAGHGLTENPFLDRAAQAKVDDMFKYQYFEHVSPQGNGVSYFVGNTGYAYIAIGENLAMGDFDGNAELVAAWMQSSGHRANILKEGYREIGVAVGFGYIEGRKAWLAVQEFGTPKTACPAVDKNLLAAADTAENEMTRFAARQDALEKKIDGQKAAVAALEKELQSIIDAHASYDIVKSKQEEYNRAIDSVNHNVGDYNAMITEAKSVYAGYKNVIEKYNAQVAAFNVCVSSFK
ncbi:MAG: CAP domain-containing protein [Candidatus Pacebacteria bacterium]|jgi:uncharacterized protein YkwD|nr:CAP domain-containing protein [Candidatus Paceibacterota bacterium]